jgi:NTP pyrophosphatase (non-canonical NTP hydrolase)
MIDLKQKELANWQLDNFGHRTNNPEWLFMGLVEEVGELGHAILKRKQGIREINHEDIGDAFADIIIYGIQLMTCEGLNAEKVIAKTIENILQRDWRKYPVNGIDK